MRALIAMMFALAACGSETTPPRPVRIRVHDEWGRPAAGRSVELDGIATVKTSLDGVANVSLAAVGPPRVRIGVRCAAEDREVAPRYVPRIITGSVPTLELSFVCRPRLRELVIVVRTPDGRGASIYADNEYLGQIADDGTLHRTLHRKPGSELRIVMRTVDDHVTLLRSVRVRERDEVVLVDANTEPRSDARESDQPGAVVAASEIPRNGAAASRAQPTKHDVRSRSTCGPDTPCPLDAR